MDYLLIASFLFLVTAMALARSGSGGGRDAAAPRALQAERQRGRGGRRIFVWGLLVRFAALAAIIVSGAIEGGISRDSIKYHNVGIEIAAMMHQGDYNWPNWIDNGWFQFTGLIYHLFGEQMLLIQLLNVFCGAATGYLAYRIALEVYDKEALARFAGYLTGLFPSFVYYSVIPLKDTVSLCSLLLIVYSVTALRSAFAVRHLVTLSLALLVVLGLRDYLFFVCLGFVLLALAPVSQRKVVRYVALMTGVVVLLGSIAYALGFGFFGLDFVMSAKYFDIDYINRTREALNRGTGGFYEDSTSARWGQGLLADALNALTGMYFFFFSIDPTDVGRTRQLFAVPEMLLILIGLPALVRGVVGSWSDCRQKALPVLIFAFGIMALYSSATTNMGAMFRWRMQSLPFFLIMLSYGVSLRRKGLLYRLMRRMSG
jgi:hypothetical protein